MKSCWDILNIAPTTDLDAIRQAYLALLPSFHPESDPQGFKR
ncbi:J domain-containing protein, partial [Salmonella enterica subsp. enterica serovar Corvallis]